MPCGYFQIFLQLKAIKKQISTTVINLCLIELNKAGYIRRSKGKGSRVYITELGLKTLRDLSKEIESANYSRKPDNTAKPGYKVIKKPKPLL